MTVYSFLQPPTSKDASECNVQEMDKAVETVEESKDSCILEVDRDMVMEDQQEHQATVDDATKTQNQVVTECQPIEWTVIERIMKTLRDCQSRKLITADPRNTATFHRGGQISHARAGFWASDPNQCSMTTSPASFFDIVYGNQGMQHFHQLTSLRDSGRSVLPAKHESSVRFKEETTDREETTRTEMNTDTHSALEQPSIGDQQDSNPEVQEENRNGNTAGSMTFPNPSDHGTEMNQRVEECLVANAQSTNLEAPQDDCNVPEIRKSGVTQLSESRALVPPRNPTAAVPPIWLDVCKAIMEMNPEALRTLASSTSNRNKAIRAQSTVDTKDQESVRGGIESSAAHSASAEDRTPRVNRKSTVTSLEAPVVSDEKPKKAATIQEPNAQPEEEKPRRHRTEQEKLERRERKRLKKEKRERKKQKKAERKERKRKERDQNPPPDDKTLDLPPQSTIQQQPPVERSFENHAVNSAKDVTDTKRDEKRRKVEKIHDGVGATRECSLVREQFDQPKVMQPKQNEKFTENLQERKDNYQKPTVRTRPSVSDDVRLLILE